MIEIDDDLYALLGYGDPWSEYESQPRIPPSAETRARKRVAEWWRRRRLGAAVAVRYRTDEERAEARRERRRTKRAEVRLAKCGPVRQLDMFAALEAA